MKRVAIAGTGVRALCFAQAIVGDCADLAQLVGLFDHNTSRMKGFCDLLGHDVPQFTDLEQMVAKVQPDTLLVCTPDHLHAEMIERAFALGMDAISEKPMTIDAAGVQRIVEAERRYGRRVTVTFNLRFMPFAALLKERLLQGTIGQIKSVHAEWFLDRTHGTEYFRRWHSNMAQSGGLLVHKSTHHFDLLNWYINDEPTEVRAMGSLQVFGKAGPFHGERCQSCAHAAECPSVLRTEDLEDPDLKTAGEGNVLRKLYFDAEQEDGYIRDRCVFHPEIDIYDTMNVLVGYKGGTQLSYTLSAYAPYAGYRFVFTGTNGRIEAEYISPATRTEAIGQDNIIRTIHGTTRDNVDIQIERVAPATGSHGGGDAIMYRRLFGEVGPDPLEQCAGSREGALSALIGACANVSIAQGRPVQVPTFDYACADAVEA